MAAISLNSLGCWLTHDYDVCETNQDCPYTRQCVDGLCRNRPEYPICSVLGEGSYACPDGYECDVSLAACIPVDATNSDVGPDGSPGDTGSAPDMGDDVSTSGEDPGLEVAIDTTIDTINEDLAVSDLSDVPETPPPSPTNVAASDGASPGFVTISWNPAPGAESYRVLRDEVEIANEVATTSFDDSEATAGDVPTAEGFNLAASDGLFPDMVRVTWDAPAVPPGSSHQYSVVAENNCGTSPPSAADTGYRAGNAITSYEVLIDDGARGDGDPWVDVGLTMTYDDTDAPRGSLTDAGRAITTTQIRFVQLDLVDVETIAGADAQYRLRAVNASGDGEDSTVVIGHRGEPTLGLQWQRSATDYDMGYDDIDGATSFTSEDSGSPIGGDARYYRCVVTPSAGPQGISDSASGYRTIQRLLPNVDVSDASFGASVSVSGDWAIVGASHETSGAQGWAELFHFEEDSGWTYQLTISGDEESDMDSFGFSVGIDGNRGLVGARFDRTSESDGLVYSFHNDPVTGWGRDDTITPQMV